MKQREQKIWSYGASGWLCYVPALTRRFLIRRLIWGVLLGCTGMPEG